MPTIDSLLSRKPADHRRVVTIPKNATALEAARVMNDHHIGALVVTFREQLNERDQIALFESFKIDLHGPRSLRGNAIYAADKSGSFSR